DSRHCGEQALKAARESGQRSAEGYTLVSLGHYLGSLFSCRRRHTIFDCDWSSDVCSSHLLATRAGSRSPRAAWLAASARSSNGRSEERRVGKEGRQGWSAENWIKEQSIAGKPLPCSGKATISMGLLLA